MHVLRVNETKAISRKDFIDNAFALEGNKKSKYNEKTLFSRLPADSWRGC